jgi:hypothetical protein
MQIILGLAAVLVLGTAAHAQSKPDEAALRDLCRSWSAKGDLNFDGSARAQRFGLMTMVAEKQNGTWLVSAVQNVNALTTPPPPEAHDIKSPIVVPQGK